MPDGIIRNRYHTSADQNQSKVSRGDNREDNTVAFNIGMFMTVVIRDHFNRAMRREGMLECVFA